MSSDSLSRRVSSSTGSPVSVRIFITISVTRRCLSPKCIYTVCLDTFARRATSSMLVRVYPLARNAWVPARRIASRFRVERRVSLTVLPASAIAGGDEDISRIVLDRPVLDYTIAN